MDFFPRKFFYIGKISYLCTRIRQMTNSGDKDSENNRDTQPKKESVMIALVHGSIAKIQKMTGYSRGTISTALNHNASGWKAEQVRRLYNLHFENKFEVKAYKRTSKR